MDDEAMKAAIKLEDRRRRRQTAGLLTFSAGLFVLVVPIVLLDDATGTMRPVLFAVMAVGLLIALGGFAAAVRFMKDANSERVASRGGYRDRVQRDYARSVGFLPFGTLLMTFYSLRSTWDVLVGRAEFTDWMFAALGPLISLVILQLVAGLSRGQDRRTRRMLEDELVVSFRQKSLNTGFAVAVAGLVLGFAAGLHNPAWAVMAMPVTLFVASATAAFRYAMLDRQADPNG